MGNYIFNRDVLINNLIEAQSKKHHDFGAHILPNMVDTGKLFAYDFESNIIPGSKPYEESGYWRDVGTIKAFFEAHIDMLGEEPAFELNNPQWPIYPSGQKAPSSKIMDAEVVNTMISEGVNIKRASIRNSVLRSGVVIEDDVTVEDSIIMDNTVLKKGCHIKRAIIDKQNVIKEGTKIGLDKEDERFGLHLDPSGIRVIPKRGLRES
jgi:glucose-1-phosphate adenylyltransferase